MPAELQRACEWAEDDMLDQELSGKEADDMLDAFDELSDEELIDYVKMSHPRGDELSDQEAFDYVNGHFRGGWESFLVQVVADE